MTDLAGGKAVQPARPSHFGKLLEPALLFSGVAIGASHLVQSTRAGAVYGLALVLVILAANLLKYPTFRFGVDYGQATRRSILAGYRHLGRWAVVLFALAIVTGASSGIGEATARVPVDQAQWLKCGRPELLDAIQLPGGAQ